MICWLLLASGCLRGLAPPAPDPLASTPQLGGADSAAFERYLRARTLASNGDPTRATRAFTWAARLDGSGSHGWAQLAAYLLDVGQLDEAERAADKALAADPSLLQAARVKGTVLARREDADALHWLALAGPAPGVAAVTARLLDQLGDPEAARAHLRDAPPASGEEAVDRALAAVSLGAFDQADELLAPALAGPGTPPSAVQLALTLGARRCDLREVHAWLARRPRLRADPAWSSVVLAVAEATGDEGWAEVVLRRQADPHALASWWAARGRDTEAEAWLRDHGATFTLTEPPPAPKDPCGAAAHAARAAATPDACEAAEAWRRAYAAEPGNREWADRWRNAVQAADCR